MYLFIDLIDLILYIMMLLCIWHIYTIHENYFFYNGVVIFFNKFFHAKTFLYKISLGESRCLSIYLFIYFCLNAWASSFSIRSHVTYGTLCHARGHSHSYLGKRRISLGVIGILNMCPHSHT